jgi:cell division protease FtsH
VSFDDIVGHDQAKRELAIVAEGFRRPDVAMSLGLSLVKGSVIMGPPGTGKSLLAKALASSVGRPVYIPPAAEMTPELLRAVYEELAGEECVVIWDEIQCLIPYYGSPKLIAAFCAAIDGVQPTTGPITIGLTAENEYGLDASALRSGRLTTKVTILPPEREERRILWERSIAAAPRTSDIDLDEVAELSDGLTGADITSMVGIALGIAMVEGTDALTHAVLLEAIGRDNHVDEEPDVPPPPVDQWIEAVHESGHALYAALTLGPDALSEVRIVVNQHSGPGTLARSNRARPASLAEMKSNVRYALAGFVAEEVVFGPDGVTSACWIDVSESTHLLTAMVGNGLGIAGFPSLNRDAMEYGAKSDRGSDEMRTQHFRVITREAAAALDDVRATLRPRRDDITRFASLLHEHPERRLVGVELADALRSVLPELVPGEPIH